MNSTTSGLFGNIYQQYLALGKNIRRLVIAGLMALVYFVVDVLVVQPLMQEFSQVTKAIESAKAESKRYALTMLDVQNKLGIDPELSDQEQVETMQGRLKLLDSEIGKISSEFVAPEQMVDLLYAMLAKSKKLSLVSMEKVEEEDLEQQAQAVMPSLNMGDQKPQAKNVADILQTLSSMKQQQQVDQEEEIFRYEVELTLQGKYHDLVDYLLQLETLPWRLFWENAQLTVKKYPVSELKVRVYTMSLTQDWMVL